MVDHVQTACVTCARGARGLARRYRDFLLAPGTLFTAASGLLLLLAIIQQPGGLIASGSAADDRTILYIAAAFVGSARIWWSAVQGIRHGDFTADVPVSIATAAAILIGQFSAAAVVAVLLLLGGLLEELVAARAGQAIEALARLLPDRVTVRRAGFDTVVPLADVRVGDVVLVRPGERVAVDGRVTTGTASVNQAAITGESLPVEKGPGDTVYAGTLSEAGALEIQAAQVGDQTTLGQIRRLVEEAQTGKAPIERLLNRYAKFYTPAALLLGIVLWVITGDILRAITMLIVFCPCVMVLATPTALVATIGNAALRGSLVKKGATVEAVAQVDTVVFDKTGTLTTGTPHLVQIVALNGLGEAEVLRLAAGAERFSEHPIGRAIVRAAQEQQLAVADPRDFEQLAGMGVQARVADRPVVLGQFRLLNSRGIFVDRDVEERVATLSQAGRTVIATAVDGQLAGLLALEDTLRPEAKATVARLQQLGLRTVLVTGDARAAAERIAGELGIDEVCAETLPQQKVEIVRHLQAQGRRVAFVGDGVNDGPALAAADVGVAMGLSGTDVAVQTAEVALLSDDLSKLPHLLDVSKQALRVIRQNLAFSLGVLALAVTLTVVGILMPVTGALLRELSSIPVIANSARLIGASSQASPRGS